MAAVRFLFGQAFQKPISDRPDPVGGQVNVGERPTCTPAKIDWRRELRRVI